jgi:hypothetical protein
LHVFLSSPMHITWPHTSDYPYSNYIWQGAILWITSLCSFLHLLITLLCLCPSIFLCTLFSNTLMLIFQNLVWQSSWHSKYSEAHHHDSPEVLRIITKLPHILTTTYGTQDWLIICSIRICLWSTVNCFELNVCYHRAHPVLCLTSVHGHHVHNTGDRLVTNSEGSQCLPLQGQLHVVLIKWWFHNIWVPFSVFPDTVVLVHGYKRDKVLRNFIPKSKPLRNFIPKAPRPCLAIKLPSNRHRESLSSGAKRPENKADHYLHLESMLRMREAVPTLPVCIQQNWAHFQ